MVPGRLLHRLTSRLAGAATLEHIVEPLIADMQREYALADRRWNGTVVLIRGYAAWSQTLTWCGLRALVSAPGRASADGVIVFSYSTAILLVLLFGVDWVHTGQPSIVLAVHRLGQLAAVLPWLLWTRFGVPGWRADRRAPGARSTIGLLLVVAAAAALACWLNPIATRAILTTNAAYVILNIAFRHVSRLRV